MNKIDDKVKDLTEVMEMIDEILADKSFKAHKDVFDDLKAVKSKASDEIFALTNDVYTSTPSTSQEIIDELWKNVQNLYADTLYTWDGIDKYLDGKSKVYQNTYKEDDWDE